MKIAQRAILQVLCSLLICMVVGMGSLPNTALCFGANGHVAVEFFSGTGCGSVDVTDSDPAAYSPDFEPSSKDHCGPCLDVPFFDDFSCARPISLQKPDHRHSPFMAAKYFDASALASHPKSSRALDHSIGFPGKSLYVLATVGLLI